MSTTNYDFNTTPVGAPGTAPTIAINGTSGGSIPGGTYYAAFTWVNADGQTSKSPSSTSVSVSGADQVKVTLPAGAAGVFPTSVTAANVYIGTLSGQEYYQGQITVSNGNATYATYSTSGTPINYLLDTAGGDVNATNININSVLNSDDGLNLVGPSASNSALLSFQTGTSPANARSIYMDTSNNLDLTNLGNNSYTDEFSNNGRADDGSLLLVRSPACHARQPQTSIVQVVRWRPTRFREGPWERLERHKPKGLRAVLRGLGSSNAPWLPGPQGSNPLGLRPGIQTARKGASASRRSLPAVGRSRPR